MRFETLFTRTPQLLDRGLGEDCALVAQQIVGMHFVVEHQFDTLEIARTQHQSLRQRLAVLDNQRRTCDVQLVQRLAIELGLALFDFQRVDHGELAIGQLRSQRRTQRAHAAFCAETHSRSCAAEVRARCTAMPPERRAD